MLTTLMMAAVLVSLSSYFHLMVLRVLRRIIDTRRIGHPLLLVILVLFCAHLVEVTLYALGLSILDMTGHGRLIGAVVGGPGWFEDHFYFSIASYTTLGIGDIVPEGPIRLIAGIEALNGLLLVAWSASFTYIVMERLWIPGSADVEGN